MDTVFKIEESDMPTLSGHLFLKSNNGHFHLLQSVSKLLNNDFLKTYNEPLIPIFKKAKSMMEKGETGIVITEQ